MANKSFSEILPNILPEIVKYNNNNPYLENLLSKVFAPILDEEKSKIDNYFDLFDPYKCPPQLLQYLCQYLGVRYNTIESIDAIRKKVENAIPFYRKKGLYESYRIIFNAMNYYVNIHDLYSPIADTRIPYRKYGADKDPNTGLPLDGIMLYRYVNNPLLSSYNMEDRSGTLNYGPKYVDFRRMESIRQYSDCDDLVEFYNKWFKTPHFEIEFYPFASENEIFRTDYEAFTYTDYKNITFSFPTKTVWTNLPINTYAFFSYEFSNELETSYISDVKIYNADLSVKFYYQDGTDDTYFIPAIDNAIDVTLNEFDLPYKKVVDDEEIFARSMTILVTPLSTINGQAVSSITMNGFLNVTEIYEKNLYPLEDLTVTSGSTIEIRPLVNEDELDWIVDNQPLSTIVDINQIKDTLTNGYDIKIDKLPIIKDFAGTDYFIDTEFIKYFVDEIEYYRPAHTVPHEILKIPFYDNYYTHDIHEDIKWKIDMCMIERIVDNKTLQYLRLIADMYILDEGGNMYKIHMDAPYTKYTRTGELETRGYVEYTACTTVDLGVNNDYFFTLKTPLNTFDGLEVSTIVDETTLSTFIHTIGAYNINDPHTFSELSAGVSWDYNLPLSSGISIPIHIYGLKNPPTVPNLSEYFIETPHDRRDMVGFTDLYRDEFLHLREVYTEILSSPDRVEIEIQTLSAPTTYIVDLIDGINEYYFYHYNIPIQLTINALSSSVGFPNKNQDWFDFNTPSYGFSHLFEESPLSTTTYCCGCGIDRSGHRPHGFLNFWGETHIRELEAMDNGYMKREVQQCQCKEFSNAYIPEHPGDVAEFVFYDNFGVDINYQLFGDTTGIVSENKYFQLIGNILNRAINYEWNFGDGTIINTNSNSIYHIYVAPGIYDVTVDISTPWGYDSKVVTSNTIQITVM